MFNIDFSGKTVLITGGTKGIGKAAALLYGQAGAQVVLTYKWGSADLDSLTAEFTDLGGKAPIYVQADVSVDEDTDALIETLKSNGISGVDVFISNVGYAATARTLDDYKKRSFFKTLEYSSWPLVSYTKKLKAAFGSYPKYVLAISSDGPDHYYKGYDYVAASKSMLEFFSKYLAVHLREEGCRVNAIRFGTVKTESFTAIFGEEFFDWSKKEYGLSDDLILMPEECGKAIFAMTSGLFDSVSGQIITADYGLPFTDNAMMRYSAWKEKQGT